MAPILPQALLEILVCPVCHEALVAGPHHDWLRCTGCGRYYPVEDGIAIMLEHRASIEPPQALLKPPRA